MDSSNRIEWVDLLKGIAIIWLIIYHFYLFDWMRSPVPVFFLLSGLFFSDGKSFSSFVGKKAKALMIPFLFFFILGLAISMMGHIVQGESYSLPPLWKFLTLFSASAEDVNPLGVGAIWFLVSLFEMYLIYYVLRLLTNNRWWLLAASVLLSLVSCASMRFYAMGSLFYMLYTFSFCIFFVVAHLFREKILYGKISSTMLLLSIISYSFRYVDIFNILNVSQTDKWGGYLSMIQWLISMMGLIFTLIWLCKKIASVKILAGLKIFKFLLFEGRNSLTILGVHLLIFGVNVVILKRFIPIGELYYVVQFLIIIIMSNICIVLFNRYIPFLVNHQSNNNHK